MPAVTSILRPAAMSSDPSPFFPAELEREIFEMAAFFHLETIFSLVLVCRRVYKWTDGIRYSTQAIQSNSKPASFFQHHVENFFFSHGLVDPKNLRKTLAACSGIQDLVLCVSMGFSGSLLPILAAMKLR
ncbi:hypothetical protein B0H14DRAFT_2927840, partial [Mycena olivaceomarginata]